jgi:hypothetical protein
MTNRAKGEHKSIACRELTAASEHGGVQHRAASRTRARTRYGHLVRILLLILHVLRPPEREGAGGGLPWPRVAVGATRRECARAGGGGEGAGVGRNRRRGREAEEREERLAGRRPGLGLGLAAPAPARAGEEEADARRSKTNPTKISGPVECTLSVRSQSNGRYSLSAGTPPAPTRVFVSSIDIFPLQTLAYHA